MIPGMYRREFLAAVAVAILVPRNIRIEAEPDLIGYWLFAFDESCEVEGTEDALEAAQGLTAAIRDAGMPDEWQAVHRGLGSFFRVFSGAAPADLPRLWHMYKFGSVIPATSRHADLSNGPASDTFRY